MSQLALHGLALPDCPVLAEGLPAHRLIALGDISALVSEACSDLEIAEAAERAALAHHRLVTAYHARTPILPVRFGSQFSSDDRLRDYLQPQIAGLSLALGSIAGLDEMTLSLAAAPRSAAPRSAAPSDSSESGSGADWLRARQAQRDRQKNRTQARAQALGALRNALERRVTRLLAVDPDTDLAKWHLLLPRPERPGLDAWLAAQGEAFDAAGLEVTLDGPWPPYSFAAALMGAADG